MDPRWTPPRIAAQFDPPSRGGLTAPFALIPRIAERVGDGIAPVAAEIARADLHTGRRLPALVFADIEKLFDALHGRGVVALGAGILERHLVLDQAFEDAVENFIGRQ